MQGEERRRALDVLNDIQYEMFQRCTVNYNNARMEEFWNDIDNLDTLFALSGKLLDEDLKDSASES